MKDKLTIVGPEPDRSDKEKLRKKPNIETILLMAKYNERFRKKLLTHREEALAETGLKLTKGERLLLKTISTKRLTENIKEFRIPGIKKSSLSSWTKAAAVLMLITSLSFLINNCRDVPKGIEPDEEPPVITEPRPTRGIDPDQEKPEDQEQEEDDQAEQGNNKE